jgi:hypothetical protein
MIGERKKYRLGEVRSILLKEWDPLCIGGNSKLMDEYDAYLPDIFGLLQNECTIADLVAALTTIERSMGLSPNESRAKLAASSLLNLNHRNS